MSRFSNERLLVTGIIKTLTQCLPYPTRIWTRCLPKSPGFVYSLSY